MVTPEEANRLSAIQQQSANVPGSVLVQATKQQADNSFVDGLTDFFSKAKEKTYGAIKNAVFEQFNVNPDTGGFAELAVKGGLLGVRSLYENVIAEPIRTIGLVQQGATFSEAYKKAQIEPFAYWREAKEKGQKIDLGTALFQSTDPEKTQTYRDLIDKGADPIRARQIAAASLGVNVFDKVFEQEKVAQFDGDRAAALIARGKSPHMTPGRVLFKPLEFIAGPEDRAYDFLTGLVDLGLNLLDPTFWAGKAVKTVRAGKSMLTLTDEGADSLGLLNGFVRKSFSKTSAQQAIDGKLGDELALFIYKNRNRPDEILLKSNFKLVNQFVIKDEALADDFAKFSNELFGLADGLDEQAAIAAVKKILTPKILAVGTEGMLPKVQKVGTFRRALDDYFGPQYTTKLSANNPDKLIVEYVKFLKLLDPAGEITNRSQRVKDMIVELGELETKNPARRGSAIVNRVIDDFSDLRTIYKNELKAAGKLTEKNNKLVDDVFTVLQKVLKEQDDAQQTLPILNKFGGVWDQFAGFMKKHPEFSKLTDEQIDEIAKTTFSKNVLESALTQDLKLQNPSQVIKLTNKLDKSFNGRYRDALGIVGESAVGRALDTYVGTIFKPLVLLRPAWTVRVIAEEQLRAVANGALGVLDHPIGLLARIFDDSIGVRGSYAKEGWLDTTMFKLGISESATGRVSKSVLKDGNRVILDNKIKYIPANRLQNIEQWGLGQWRVINLLRSDTLSKKVAAIELSDDPAKGFVELTTALKTEGNEYREAMLNLTAGNSNLLKILQNKNGLTKKEYDEAIATFVEGLRNNLKGFLSNDGKSINADLYNVVITGKFKNAKGETINLDTARNIGAKQSDLELLSQDALLPKEAKKLQKDVDKYEEAVRKEYLDKFGGEGVLPDTVDYLAEPISVPKGFYDKWTERFFSWFMTQPTNTMSRIPVFKSSYWKKSEELISISSEGVKQKIIAGAEKAGLNKKTINRMKKIKSGGDNGIDDAELIERMAKGFGVDQTKKLLYDITEQRRFWETSRWLFPFGNAYQEVLTTWLGIMKANPQVAARTGTIWDGAAQENDAFGPTGKGIFYKNPINGQVVFNYPGTGLLQDWMFEDAPNQDVRVNMPVYAESINIAAGLLPGFGPVVQIPASFIFKNFPEEGLVNKILFGEFPPLDVNNKDEWTKALGLKPAWADKFIKLIFNKGENAQGAFGNTVIDTYKALLYAGVIDDSTEEKAKEGMQIATDAAQRIFLFRAVSQFLGPAGAASPIFELTDKNLDYFMFETLADEYRKIKESKNFDDALATQEFIEIYGINPLPLTVSKTISIEKYPTTVEGADWMKKNMEIYEKYPLVAWYLEPPPSYAEFSFDAYKKSLLEGARVYRTPEQWAVAKNKLLGSVALEQYERTINIVGNNTAPAKALRDAKKKELEQRYWGYGQPSIVGSPNKPTIEQQIDQLIKMVNDPELQNYETLQAAKKYLAIRQQIIDSFVAAGKSETIWKTGKDYAGVRAALRQEANKIIAETPKFGPMFDTLLSREIEPEYEDDLIVQLGLGK
jgi:hypothetical protein